MNLNSENSPTVFTPVLTECFVCKVTWTVTPFHQLQHEAATHSGADGLWAGVCCVTSLVESVTICSKSGVG